MKITSDKKLHFLVGLAIALVLNIWVCILAGAGKEIYDKISKKGTPEFMDFVCTVLGGLVGILALLIFGVEFDLSLLRINIMELFKWI